MVAELKYKPNCKMPFVTIGIKLATNMKRPDIRAYFNHTTVDYIRTGYCLHCGNPFFSYVAGKNKNRKFCSNSCANKYRGQKIKEANLRIAYKNVNEQEFTEFFKKYNNFVFSEIFSYESEYHEDLIDKWQERAIWWFFKIKKWERTHSPNRFSFLKTAISREKQNIINKRKNNGEVFYSECNVKTQELILGDYNSIYN